MGPEQVIERIDDPEPSDSAANEQVACGSGPDDQAARRIDPNDLAVLLELIGND
jgi:hypothetical protein